MGEVASVNEFLQKVENLYEIEYGDFKRKVGLYLNRLEEKIQNPSQDVQELFTEIRRQVLFDPSGEIEPTRQFVLEKGQKIQALVEKNSG